MSDSDTDGDEYLYKILVVGGKGNSENSGLTNFTRSWKWKDELGLSSYRRKDRLSRQASRFCVYAAEKRKERKK